MNYSLPTKLRVLIVDADSISGGILRTVVENHPDVEFVKLVRDTQSARKFLDDCNTIFIDIFTVGVKSGVDFIERVRDDYPITSFCLYSTSDALRTMAGVSEYWKNRFSHYFKLPKDIPANSMSESVERVLYELARYVQAEFAKRKISVFRAHLAKETASGLTPEQKRELDETVAAAEKALQAQEPPQKLDIVPGVNTGQLEQLVNMTLQEASQSLQVTTRINIGVLGIGTLLCVGSFIVALITNRWEAVAFGGFGIAGIIASLITNPLRSIGASASRLVQVQVAYLQFLSQLGLLTQGDETNNIDRSKRLGDAMEQTLKVLGEQFGK